MKILKKWSMTLVVFGLAAAFVAGCGGGGGGGGSSTPAVTTGSLKFVNNSSFGIDEAYLALPSSSTWGSKRNSSSIGAGSSWTLTGITPATYDSRVVSIGTTSTYYAYSFGFGITAGNTFTLTATDSSYTGSLIINNNNATYPITALYISTTSLGGGSNVLVSNIAPLTTNRQIVNIPSGTYYVRAVQNGVNRDNSGVPIVSHGYTTISYN